MGGARLRTQDPTGALRMDCVLLGAPLRVARDLGIKDADRCSHGVTGERRAAGQKAQS